MTPRVRRSRISPPRSASRSRRVAGRWRAATASRKSTKARVAEAARESGYVPNRAARALVSGRSDFAGLVLPIRGHGFEDAFLGELVSGLGDRARRAWHRPLPRRGARRQVRARGHPATSSRPAAPTAWCSPAPPRTTSGSPTSSSAASPSSRTAASPTPRPGHRWLDTDGAAAFAEAFELLYGLGHRHFGLVTIDEPMNFRRLRTEGLEAAIAAARRPRGPARHRRRRRASTAPRRAAAIRSMLTAAPRPTAVIGLFDGLALAVLEEAASLGLEVPRDLSVVGFDDVPAAAITPAGAHHLRRRHPRQRRRDRRHAGARDRRPRRPRPRPGWCGRGWCCAAATGRRPDGFTMRTRTREETMTTLRNRLARRRPRGGRGGPRRAVERAGAVLVDPGQPGRGDPGDARRRARRLPGRRRLPAVGRTGPWLTRLQAELAGRLRHDRACSAACTASFASIAGRPRRPLRRRRSAARCSPSLTGARQARHRASRSTCPGCRRPTSWPRTSRRCSTCPRAPTSTRSPTTSWSPGRRRWPRRPARRSSASRPARRA